ncbi:hypothetical protein [Haloarcula nitratireducens]|uniref:SWIM-type domain-containing protein n=1 Tax=Haloarcula nitratireducens TaxID=2487749 RepID=A0AAW4PL79_9EURY|nr:hypothetical protein [Halomicroarcula nitratireducens]MBX0298055.1 hypothetical protein [Halomicroarcula nitratireducens]
MKTAESPTPTSDSASIETHVAAQPDGTHDLDFPAVRETRPAMWSAALEATVTIEHGNRPDLFVVMLDDSQPANCSLARHSEGDYAGWCSCRSFTETGVCPHLCALRQRAILNDVAIPVKQL